MTYEDENIVIQGSALDEHLSSWGYRDFESVSLNKHEIQVKDGFWSINLKHCIESISWRLYSIYSWITQEETFSKQQISMVMGSKVLLDDHASEIQKCFEELPSTLWRVRMRNFILVGSVTIITAWTLASDRLRLPYSICVASSLLAFTCVNYKRMCAQKHLENIILHQNEIFDVCKKNLKILKYRYEMKIRKASSGKPFYELGTNKLKLLQPVAESTISGIRCMSQICYKMSSILSKLLPQNVLSANFITVFKNELFDIRGEITYEELKELYHIYILTQSEMLRSLAIAYDINIWKRSRRIFPEEQLSYFVTNLIYYLAKQKNNMSAAIKSYHISSEDRTICKYTVKTKTKWQDLYVHLHLTSKKLQLAYDHISCLLEYIDRSESESEIEAVSIDIAMEKLNQLYQEIEAAKTFTEFSSLLVARARYRNRSPDVPEINHAAPDVKVESCVVSDSEPRIVDEVFEDYIKEEYLKPLYDECTQSALDDYKWDKFFAKTFMTELKNALTDKKESMAERESKALQRMYQSMRTEDHLKNATDHCHQIPVPPPMPCLDEIHATCGMPSEIRMNYKEISIQNRKQSASEEQIKSTPGANRLSGKECITPFTSIQTAFDMTAQQNILQLVPLSCKVNEEIFAGSGEDSEEEFSDTNCNDHGTVS